MELPAEAPGPKTNGNTAPRLLLTCRYTATNVIHAVVPTGCRYTRDPRGRRMQEMASHCIWRRLHRGV
jgi:hypothetical protein